MYEASVPVTKLPTQCPLCLDTYSRPRALPCLHSFCSDCLHSYVTSAQTISSFSPFPCPVCRLPTKPPRPYVPRNEWVTQFPVNHVIVSLLDEVRAQPERRRLHGLPLCPQHPETEVNMHCGDHDDMFCPRCVALHHRSCEHVSDIDQLLQTIDIGENIEKFVNYAKEMDNNVTDIQAKCTLAQSKLDIECDRIKESISSEKYRLIEHLENMETEVHRQVDDMANTYKDRIDGEKEFADVGKSLCSESIRDLGLVSGNTISPVQKYATLHKHMKALRVHFNDTPRPDISGDVKFDFKPNTYFSDENICSAGSLGSVAINVPANEIENEEDAHASCTIVDELPISYNSLNRPENCLVVRATSHIAEERCGSVLFSRTAPYISVRPSLFSSRSSLHLAHSVTGFKFLCSLDNQESKRQWVSGSAFLHDKMTILCSQTGSLLAINRDKKLVYEEVQQSPPWGVVRMAEARIAVTYPQERLVRIFDVHCSSTVLKLFKKPAIITKPLVEYRKFNAGADCYGIAILGNNLITACEDYIKVFTPAGQCLQTLKPKSHDATHNEFRRIQAIAVDPFRYSVYISDEANHAVLGFQCNYQRNLVHEKPTFVFSHDRLRSPQGLAVNSSGEIYVCGFVSKNIHVVSSSGESLKEFPMLQRPYSISVDAPHAQAIVTFYPESDLDHCSPVIHMYKLNP